MITLTVGDGKTYSSIANAIASIPDPMTDDYRIEVYKNVGDSLIYTTSAITVPNNSQGSKYQLIIEGMEGSIQAGGQVEVQSSVDELYILNFASYLNSGPVVKNLKLTGSGSAICIYYGSGYEAVAIDVDCYTENRYAIYSAGWVRVFNSMIECPNNYAIYGGNANLSLDYCIVRGTNGVLYQLGGYEHITNSIIIATSGKPVQTHERLLFKNCALIGTTGIFNSYTADSRSAHRVTFHNTVLYSTDGNFASGVTIADYLSEFDGVRCFNTSEADPLLTGGVGTLKEYATPQSGSPLLASNIGGLANPLYNTTNNPQSIGVYDDYSAPDYPEVENVLTTDTVNGTQGTWTPADAQYYLVDRTFGVDGTSVTGTLQPEGAMPPQPLIDSFINKDGEVTLTIVCDDDDNDNVYYRYRTVPSGDWSDENDTPDRVGSGDITISELVNYETYEVIVYSRYTNGPASEWSKPIYAVPRP